MSLTKVWFFSWESLLNIDVNRKKLWKEPEKSIRWQVSKKVPIKNLTCSSRPNDYSRLFIQILTYFGPKLKTWRIIVKLVLSTVCCKLCQRNKPLNKSLWIGSKCYDVVISRSQGLQTSIVSMFSNFLQWCSGVEAPSPEVLAMSYLLWITINQLQQPHVFQYYLQWRTGAPCCKSNHFSLSQTVQYHLTEAPWFETTWQNITVKLKQKCGSITIKSHMYTCMVLRKYVYAIEICV